MKEINDSVIIKQIDDTKEIDDFGQGNIWCRLIKIEKYYIKIYCGISDRLIIKKYYEVSEEELRDLGFKAISKKLVEIIKSMEI